MFYVGGPEAANHKYFRACAPTSWQYKRSTTSCQSTDEDPCDDPDPGARGPIPDLIPALGGPEAPGVGSTGGLQGTNQGPMGGLGGG